MAAPQGEFAAVKIGNGEFWMGDCLELMARIPDGSVDMVLCDLPYGTTQNKWDSVLPLGRLWAEYDRVCKPSAAIVLTAAQPFTTALIASRMGRFRYTWTWKKSKPTGHLNAKKQPLRNTEDVVVFYKEQCIYNPQGTRPTNHVVKRTNRGNYGDCSKETLQTVTGYPTSVIEFATENGFHQTQKPVPLFDYLIRTYTNPGDLVLDNCAGSGTTAVAAEQTGRRWICIEREPSYYYGAIGRIAAL